MANRATTLLAGITVLPLRCFIAARGDPGASGKNPGCLGYLFLERQVGGGPGRDRMATSLVGLPRAAGWRIAMDRLSARRGARRVGPPPGFGRHAAIVELADRLDAAEAAGSKLATYVWPVFPAMAVLTATAWLRLIDGTLTAAARRSFPRTSSGRRREDRWCCRPPPGDAGLFGVRFAWPVWVAVAIAAALAPVPLIPSHHGRWQASLAAAALSVAAQFAAVITMVLPPVAETFSGPLAQRFNRLGHLPRAAIGRRGPPRLASIILPRSFAANRRPTGFSNGRPRNCPPATGRRDRRARAQGHRAASVSPLRGQPVGDGGPLPAGIGSPVRDEAAE